MKKLYAVWAVSVMFMLSACAQLGIAQPQTFNQKLAVAYGTVTSIRMSTLTLLQTNKITSDDAANVQMAADSARMGLDTARSLSLSQPEAAQNKLESVRAVLTALSAYLATKQK